ncbi:Wzz/FepE/Etk N-terminal domain-containing protein [Sulfurimonas sp.]|uniref:Wzz/FepE/Etk N-terminal domain-containing protein n=1 Tax=Sulfurimonas sp. TaxID=2022749 RepID=UPI003567D1A7
MQEKQFIQKDDNELKELFKTILKYKKVIVIFTLVFTLASVLYVVFKPYKPIYKGKLLVEIGEVFNADNDAELIDKSKNLEEVINAKLNKHKIYASTPKRTTSLIELISQDQDKEKIKSTLEKAYQFIINRHSEKTKVYEKYTPTKKVGDIVIGNKPVNKPKKKLIVILAFITGFILSIFLVIFIEFVRSFKE